MSVRVFFGVCIATLLLASCANGPSPTSKVKPKVKVEPTKKTLKDSRYYITQAKLAFAEQQDIYQRNEWLLQASATLLQEQQAQTSINLLNVLLPEIKDRKQLSFGYLLLAEGYDYLSHPNNEEFITKCLNNIIPEHVPQHRLTKLKYQQSIVQKNWLQAANYLFQTAADENQKSAKIWQAVEQLSLSELEKSRWDHPNLLPWIQLAIVVQKYGLSPTLLSQQVAAWQDQNLGHPLQQSLPKNILAALSPSPIQTENIAVLLPLTGRLASQGQMLKEGFLTAYLQDLHTQSSNENNDVNQSTLTVPERQYKRVQFINSNLKTPEQLNALVEDYNVVVGPLLKSKISGLSAMLAEDKTLLALNRTDNVEQPADVQTSENSYAAQSKEHYYFSLAPEDEAKQLAQHIRRQQFNRPIIFADDISTTKRMAEAFIQEWNTFEDTQPPTLTLFSNNKDMRKSVANMLDVEQSKNRIKLMERLSDVEVFSQERNRRDIDSVVLFANPEQTGLLNPIIEASMSSFAEISLSVFASSRSFSQHQTDSSLRDLRHLTFSDMPWLLPEHDWPELAAQSHALWPQRQDSLARFFAMGYDAYSFIPQLKQLKTLPQITSHGLTGKINIESNGIIRRQLPWAKIEKNKVTVLGMD